MLPSAWGTLRCNAAGCLIVAGCYRLKEWKPELLDKVLFGKLTPLPMPSAAPALSLTSVGVSIGKGRGCQQINDSDRRSAGKLTSSFCGAISAFGATWCAPPGPHINIPAWVLCTSWGANFESRGDAVATPPLCFVAGLGSLRRLTSGSTRHSALVRWAPCRPLTTQCSIRLHRRAQKTSPDTLLWRASTEHFFILLRVYTLNKTVCWPPGFCGLLLRHHGRYESRERAVTLIASRFRGRGSRRLLKLQSAV